MTCRTPTALAHAHDKGLRIVASFGSVDGSHHCARLVQPRLAKQLRQQALEPVDISTEAIAAWVKTQTAQWAGAIRDGNIQPD